MAFKNLFRPSLNKKLIAIMLLLNLGLIALLLFVYYQSEKALGNEFERQTARVISAVQIGLEEAAKHGVSDERKVKEYLERLKLKGVTEISIISTSDRIISSTDPRNVGKWVSRNKRELIVKADLGEPVTGDGQDYFIMVPVMLGEKQMGYVHLSLNTEDFSVFLKTGLIRRIVGASAIFFVGMVLAIILSQRYTRPIRQTVEAANRIAAGDLDVRLETRRKDEIGELSRSFNYMVERLREEKDLTDRLRRAEHMSTVGELAQSVAHEIKNPLNFISLSVDHLKESLAKDAPAEAGRYGSMLDNMKSEVQRMSRFLTSFLQLGKPLELKLQKTDLCGQISQAFELVAPRAAREGIELRTDFACSPAIDADPELLKTCICNIVLNSLQSMEGGGTLTARVLCESKKLHVVFEDTGKGVPEAEAAKVFTPYFTTKADGLGLGLALTKRIIEDHDGRIGFMSAPGKGSTVTITLPLDGGGGQGAHGTDS